MKTLLCSIVLTGGILIAATANAQRPPIPIIEHEKMQIATGSGAKLTAEAVAKAITVGAGAGKRVWSVSRLADNRLLATYPVRTHSISVNISYWDNAYSIQYATSVNMKYGVIDGVKVIHPFYNKWVEELKRSINAEFNRL